MIIKVIFYYHILFFRPWWIVLWAPLNLEMSHMTLLLRLVHAWNAPLLKILSAGLIRYKMLFSCIIASAFIFLLTFSVIVSHIKPRTKLNRNGKKWLLNCHLKMLSSYQKRNSSCACLSCAPLRQIMDIKTNFYYFAMKLIIFFLIKYYDFSLAVR